MNKEEIINKIKQYVQEESESIESSHDWYHIQRVYNNAMLINKEENANEFIITIIVLMHDIYDHKFYKGNIQEKLVETLKELQVYEHLSKEDIENIVYSCINLGFSSNMAEKKKLSIEGQIAQDADRLDALGAMGIARTFAYSGEKGKPMHIPNDDEAVSEEEYKQNGSVSAIGHFYDKLLKIKNLMNTETARKIAIERHKFVEIYLKEFLDEWNGLK